MKVKLFGDLFRRNRLKGKGRCYVIARIKTDSSDSSLSLLSTLLVSLMIIVNKKTKIRSS